MDGKTDSLLLELYFTDEWTYRKSDVDEALRPFVYRIKKKDALGRPYYMVSLNGEGHKLCRWILKKYDRVSEPKRGLAMEERIWHEPMPSSLTVKEMVSEFESFASEADIPIQVIDEGVRTRVVLVGLERGLARVEHLPSWLKQYFGRREVRQKIMSLGERTEFVLWDEK
jgi:hypothetical protein